MYCPKCSQQQVSGATSFCSRCGFQLDQVKELLVADSSAPLLEKARRMPRRSARREGVRQGVILIFICMVLLPLGDLIGSHRGEFVSLMFFMAGLMRILYAAFFQESAPQKRPVDRSVWELAPAVTGQIGASTNGAALPPAQYVPAPGWQNQMNTGEMAVPPSVTEHTTKLLSISEE